MMELKDYSKYIMVFMFIVVLYFTSLLIKPFIISILSSLVLAYVFYPVYKKLNRYIKNQNISAFIISILLVIIVTIPLFFMVNNVVKEVLVIYTIGEQRIVSGNLLGVDCDKNPYWCNKLDFVTTNFKLRYYLQEHLGQFKDVITENLTEFVFSLPRRLLDIIITLFVTFYLFKDGKNIASRLRSVFVLKEKHEKPLLKRLNEIIYAVIYGNVLVSIIEGLIGGFTFWFIGIPSPIFWGLIMWILALLPIVGAAVIWLPAALILMLNGYTGSAVTLIIAGLIMSIIDMVGKPRVIGQRANVHPVFILIGVLGGVALFGFIGFIVGPLILALLVTFLEIYEKEKIMFGDNL